LDAIFVYWNDVPIKTWSIASSKRVTFLIVTLYVDSSNCLMNSFMALTFSLDFLAALFAIASTAVMSSSLSIPSQLFIIVEENIANDHVNNVS
jgi:hypothetical protein